MSDPEAKYAELNKGTSILRAFGKKEIYFLYPLFVFIFLLPFSTPRTEMERLTSTTLLPDNFMDTRDDITEQLSMIWSQVKAPLIVPLLKLAVLLCLLMSAMLFVERVYMGVVILLVKLFGRKPDKRYKWEPLKDDVELGNSNYPMVLVQIPMYNEKEVIFFSLSFSYSSFIHSFILTHTYIQTGLPAFHWSCMRAFLAVRPYHNSSS